MLKLLKMHFSIMFRTSNTKSLLLSICIFLMFNLVYSFIFFAKSYGGENIGRDFNIAMMFPLISIFIVMILAASNAYSVTSQNDSKTTETNDGVLENILPIGRENYFFGRILFTICNGVIIWYLILFPFLIATVLLNLKGATANTDFLKGLFFTTAILIITGVALSIVYVVWKKNRVILLASIFTYIAIPIISYVLAYTDYLAISKSGWIVYPTILAVFVLIIYLWARARIQRIDLFN